MNPFVISDRGQQRSSAPVICPAGLLANTVLIATISLELLNQKYFKHNMNIKEVCLLLPFQKF